MKNSIMNTFGLIPRHTKITKFFIGCYNNDRPSETMPIAGWYLYIPVPSFNIYRIRYNSHNGVRSQRIVINIKFIMSRRSNQRRLWSLQIKTQCLKSIIKQRHPNHGGRGGAAAHCYLNSVGAALAVLKMLLQLYFEVFEVN